MPKRVKVILITLGIIIVLGVIIVIYGTRGMSEIRNFKLPDIKMSTINDGEYEGSGTISRWAMSAKVTVKDHKIISIDIVKNMMSSMPAALVAKINRKVIEKQSPDIDAVSGASITTKAYMIAVADALKKGEPDGQP